MRDKKPTPKELADQFIFVKPEQYTTTNFKFTNFIDAKSDFQSKV